MGGFLGDGRTAAYAAAAVAVHLLATLAHGGVHVVGSVPTTPFQAAVVAVVLLAAPVAAVALLVRGRPRLGGSLLVAAMAGSLLFTGYFHWLSATADNVAAVGAPWHGPFEATAAATLAADAAGVLVGGRAIRGARRDPSVDAGEGTTPG